MKSIKCEKCDNLITPEVARFSRNAFGGQELCISCQKKERIKHYPKRLAEFLNGRIY